MNTWTPHSPELHQFNVEIESLLKQQNPRARSLIYFIKRELWQFNLDSIYTEVDILNEAYIRGVSLILKSGTAINNPLAWLRTTTWNIVRELSRSHQRYQRVAYDELLESQKLRLELASMPSEDSLISDEVVELNIQAILSSFHELTSREQIIIQLKAMQGLSWKEVSQHLVKLGEEEQTEAALRKRGQRAMERLRQLYHQKRPAKGTEA